jgi:hypothetical protein
MFVLVHHFVQNGQGFMRVSHFHDLSVTPLILDVNIEFSLLENRPGWVTIRCHNNFYMTFG